ncbi:hypothetical protein E4U38_004589 [Claviceps purpurea]|nr:hypothetical protein E4U38_004589 [Claviceps purpurea]
MVFKEATFASEKADTVLKLDDTFVWPNEKDLWRAPDIYTGHLVTDPTITNTSFELGLQSMRNESSSSRTSKILQSLRDKTPSSETSKILQSLRDNTSSSGTGKDITRDV